MQCQSETKGRNESLNLNKVAANSLHMEVLIFKKAINCCSG